MFGRRRLRSNHTHRNTESLVRKKTKKDIFIRKLEMELQRKLGTKVEIAPGQKRW